ncbi:hypothetical protein [Aquabacterium sp. J223]|uniref:hypothetical protein n=1 Tax=Aquabacterium sp. J223 TaxID=2898431 RepID=UPI0021AE0898|nr:hypothetical protein [Aquabacterium sp. J223]UUX94805.1 hypothetical protein LRS07_16185 [Aquabacterium sp. J223]
MSQGAPANALAAPGSGDDGEPAVRTSQDGGSWAPLVETGLLLLLLVGLSGLLYLLLGAVCCGR